MDDQRIGATFRAIRVRKGWRQRDLARRAGVSQATVSRIERGLLSGIPLGTLRAVATALEAQFDPLVRWHGGDLPRLLGARHAALHEAASRLFGSLAGWLAEPEVSFSIYGERGVIDVFAWHAATRSLLVVELKTEFVDVNELMGTLDRKRRLAPVVAQDRGWGPSHGFDLGPRRGQPDQPAGRGGACPRPSSQASGRRPDDAGVGAAAGWAR